MRNSRSRLAGYWKAPRSRSASCCSAIICFALQTRHERPSDQPYAWRYNNIGAAIVTNVSRHSHLRTDDVRFYSNISHEFATPDTSLHGNREFSRVNGNQSNTAENFFTLRNGARSTPDVTGRKRICTAIWQSSSFFFTEDICDRVRTDQALPVSFGKRLTRTAALAA